MSKRAAPGGGARAAAAAPASSDSELAAEELYLSSDAEPDGEEAHARTSTSGLADSDSEAGWSDGEAGEGDAAEAGPSGRGLPPSADELDASLVDLMTGTAGRRQAGAGAGPAGREGPEAAQPSLPAAHDEGSDSSEDERPNRNTVGDVPLEWYKDEEHIGYDRAGAKLLKKAGRRDALDALLARADGGAEWRTVYDDYNDEEIVLTKEEMAMVRQIQRGRFPHVQVNPYEPLDEWFSSEPEIHPLHNAPEPKRRFTPSKWEEKKVVKLVRALRKGWIKRTSERVAPSEELPAYLLWEDDGQVADKTVNGLAYIPAPKAALPGHEESYRPPAEYLPSQEERNAWHLADPEQRPALLPHAFDSLRRVPAYADFIKERFERCLDLYLCPRARKKRLNLDPQALLPQLPKPRDLQPFPTTLLLRYVGHTAKVWSVAPDPSGQWLASGSADGSLRLWEVRTGRCLRTWQLGAPVRCVAWCPNRALRLLSATAGSTVYLLPSGVGGEEVQAAAEAALQPGSQGEGDAKPLCRWQHHEESGGLALAHQHPVTHLTWHARGDYFASVAPTGNTQAVLVHQLSKRVTQNPFRKNRGRVARVLFHPAKPFLFVATQNHVRIYNLAKQVLAKKLIGGSGSITSLAVHPSGDHVIVGSQDKRLAWFDLDLSAQPYRALRYHGAALRGVAFHASYPLFASASDDGTAHVFHGTVYQDLMTNPLIVPVKILRGHTRVEYEGVLDCAFHPTQPWLFTAGADSSICLFCN